METTATQTHELLPSQMNRAQLIDYLRAHDAYLPGMSKDPVGWLRAAARKVRYEGDSTRDVAHPTAIEMEQAQHNADAFAAGQRKGKSLNPGRPRAEAATYPTADEREAFVKGWYNGRRKAGEWGGIA